MNNQRTPLLILLCCIFAATLFAGAACARQIRNEKTLTSITVSNLPEEAIVIGEFDAAGITLNLNYSDGEVDYIPVRESLIPDEYKPLLHTSGTSQVKILYRGLTATFTVTMREKYEWTVTFLNALDEVVKTQVITEEDPQDISYPTAEEMAVSGYRFTGFPQVSTPVTQNITVKGEYVKTWVVKFYNGNNAVISEQIVDNGTAATEPTEEQRATEGFTFVSWDIEFDNILKDTNVYGVYVEVTTPAQDLYTRDGNYIYFGSYPQTEVTDSTVTAALNTAAGTLPTSSNSRSWTSYGYYIENEVQNYMWYIDISYGGETYRGVYFTSYRPYWTTYSSSTDNTHQDDNGYTVNNVYWFKWEPIKWRILEESNGYATLLCEMIIDSQTYQNKYTYDSNTGSYYNTSEGTPSGTYVNNYQYSAIRKWLNETFYETAFNSLQKAIIQTVTVDNSARSTNPDNNETQFNSGNNSYACANTNDKVWLLSEQEVTRAAYGFSTSYSNNDTARRKQSTDYAKSQGCWQSTSTDYKGNGCWWLRSPYCDRSYRAGSVYTGGDASFDSNVNCTNYGVLPALKIAL